MNDLPRRFCICNFGCKVNQEEGSSVAALFSQAGWQEADVSAADLIIINTCTVTQIADKKARNLIRRLHRCYPRAMIVVCGCYAQRAADEVAALPGVAIVAGVEERRRLPQLVADYLASGGQQRAVAPITAVRQFQRIAAGSGQHRARAYLKIEDGCDQFCHYCIIPYVRGPVRSLQPELALQQAELLLQQGHREIVLSGIHIGAYGQDLEQPDALVELIRRLCALPGLLRLRLGSIEPQQFDDALIALIGSEEKLCRHLHIPLQSGCDRTLAAMGRHYDTAFYAALLQRLRQTGGDIAFTTDVMTGYPGETPTDHAASLEFCRSCGFAGMHVFPYSRRAGTKAAALPHQVPQALKAKRAAALAACAADAAAAYADRWIGHALDFLAEEQVEWEGTPCWRGHSGNYLTLLLPVEADPTPPCCSVRVLRRSGEVLLTERVVATAHS